MVFLRDHMISEEGTILKHNPYQVPRYKPALWTSSRRRLCVVFFLLPSLRRMYPITGLTIKPMSTVERRRTSISKNNHFLASHDLRLQSGEDWAPRPLTNKYLLFYVFFASFAEDAVTFWIIRDRKRKFLWFFCTKRGICWSGSKFKLPRTL